MNLKRVSIKFKLIIVGIIFISGITISFFGVIEILKVTKLKSLVREHMDYMVIFIKKSENLIDSIEEKKFKEATHLINKNAFAIEDMGTLKLIKSIKDVTIRADESINIVEEYLFRLAGFNIAFDLIKEDIENCKKLESIFLKIEQKKYKDIEKEILFLQKYLDEIEDKEDEFELTIMSASEFVQHIIFTLLIIISLISLLLLYYISKSILNSISNFQNGLIDFFSYLNHEKESIKEIKVDSNDEFKKMSEVINRYIKSTAKSISEDISIVESVAKGDYSVQMRSKGSDDKFATSMNAMIDRLRKTKKLNEEQNWLKDGINGLNKKLSGNLSINRVTNNSILFLCEYLDGFMGVLYLKKDDILELNGKYAFLPKRGLLNSYKLGEGIIGQVATQKSPIILKSSNNKDAYTYTYPLIYENELYGVLEVASSSEFNRLYLEFLNSSSQIIATYLFVAIQNEKISELVKDKKDLN